MKNITSSLVLNIWGLEYLDAWMPWRHLISQDKWTMPTTEVQHHTAARAVCSSKWWHRQLSRVLSAGRTRSLCSLLRKMDREIQSIVDLIQPFWWNHAHLVNGCMFKTLCCLNEYLWHTHSWGPSLPKPQSSDFGNQIYPKPLPSEGSFSLCPLCIMNRWSFC